MIQINLLPDVKQEYLRAQQTKHLVVVASVLLSLISVVVLAILFLYVQVVQPRHRANLQRDIDSGLNELKGKQDAVKIVTVQGVLEQIPALQDKKLLTSRLFTYLTSVTPQSVNYGEVRLDLTANTVSLTGQANTFEQTSELTNNLKSAMFTYKQGDNESKVQPFSRIVFTSLGKSDQTDTTRSVAFQLTFSVDPALFNEGVSEGKLTVDAASEKLLLPSAQPFGAAPVSGGQ
ncbi:MAG: hypothetical protein U0520_01200 [Candidatus Saccharimonadales bacterium]